MSKPIVSYRNKNISLGVFEAGKRPNIVIQRSFRAKRDMPEQIIPAVKMGEWVNRDLSFYEHEMDSLTVVVKEYNNGKITKNAEKV